MKLRLIAFDIDGTLTRTAEAFDGLFARSVHKVLGVVMHQRWSGYQSSTDSGILSEATGLALGRALTREEVSAVQAEYHQQLEAIANLAEPTLGSQDALNAVAREPGVEGCFVTGNWRRAAELKLAGAGLQNPGFPIFSADDSAQRDGILKSALQVNNVPASECVYLGDAPWDARAATRVGVRFVGVVQSRDRFGAASVARLIDFADLKAFWSTLTRATVPDPI